MQNQDECLTQAMYLASESYSGSSYNSIYTEPMDVFCEGLSALTHDVDAFRAPAMAA